MRIIQVIWRGPARADMWLVDGQTSLGRTAFLNSGREPLIGISLFGILFGILSSDRHFSLSVTSRALWPLPPAATKILFRCRRRRRTMTMTDNTTTMILLRHRRRRRRRTKTMTMKHHHHHHHRRPKILRFYSAAAAAAATPNHIALRQGESKKVRRRITENHVTINM